jgi:hypothetical protein
VARSAAAPRESRVFIIGGALGDALGGGVGWTAKRATTPAGAQASSERRHIRMRNDAMAANHPKWRAILVQNLSKKGEELDLN